MKLSMLGLLVATLGGATGGDHLVPEPGVFSSSHVGHVCYQLALREALLQKGSPRPIQMVAIPAHRSEYAVFVQIRDGKPRVVARRLKSNLWKSAFSSAQAPVDMNSNETCDSFRAVEKQVEESSAPLDRARFERLKTLWRRALAEVRLPTASNDGLDGVRYHFGECGEVGCVSGMAWSPREGTRLAKLTGVADLLVEYSKADDRARPKCEKQLDQAIDSALRAFGGSEPSNE